MMRVPEWEREGRDWPNREHSHFVEAGDLRWHVQVMGSGPPVLLLHGTGAATHSWRDLGPLLATNFTVIAPDLPGHGFTSPPREASRYALPCVVDAIKSLTAALGLEPHVVIGHSAGAAIGVRMALDCGGVERVIGLNAALLPFPGPFGHWAPLLARGLFYNPFAIAMFAARAVRPGAVQALLRSTGSNIEAHGISFYQRLFQKPSHIEATIGLMAHWDLVTLRRDIASLAATLDLIVGDEDRAVPPRSAEGLEGVVPSLSVTHLSGLGHLAHEEAPARVADMILEKLGGGK